jgi:hypothetical protein
LPTSPTTTVSFAVRWHGERPAVLWEQQGDPTVALFAPAIDPDWTTTQRSGETLWPAPVVERPKPTGLQLTIDPDEGSSFV